jgi:cell wall-associated NlpC family hydrolase
MEKSGESADNIIIRLPDGREGFVKKNNTIDFAQFCTDSIVNTDKLISDASSLIGVPYLWGGTSPKGVDCSGFVQSVFFRNGLILQRDASLQVLHGKNVEISEGKSQLTKGDLLFFGSDKNNKVHVTHVALYIGNNEYINSSGRVIINSLDSTKSNYSYYRKNSFLAARKVFGVKNDPGIIPVNKHPWYR